jgi:hypothetical protein
MGKHAAPRKPLLRSRAAQRTVAISGGTLALCLGAAAPAIATTGLPNPPPLPQPIVDTVQTVSDIAGIPNPVATPTAPKTKHHDHRDATQQQAQPAPVKHTTSSTKTPPAKAEPVTPAWRPATFAVSGLRSEPATRTAAIAERAPAMAHTPTTTTRIVQTAGERVLGGLPGMPPAQDTARVLAIAFAMTVVGGLASGHIKAAQSRTVA